MARKVRFVTSQGKEVVTPTRDIETIMGKEDIKSLIGSSKETLQTLMSLGEENGKPKEILKELEEIESSLDNANEAYLLNLRPLLRLLAKTISEIEKKERVERSKERIKEERERVEEKELPPFFKTTAELNEQMTTGRKRGESLFDIVSDEETLEIIKSHESNGEMISTLTSGLALSSLENKTIKGLQAVLYKQSEGFTRKGLPKEFLEQNGIFDQEKVIYIDAKSFTKLVLGRDSVSGHEVRQVLRGVARLDGCYAYNQKDGTLNRVYTIEKVTEGQMDKNGDYTGGRFFIYLRDWFYNGLENNFISTPSNELKLLSGISSDMSLRLYDILKALVSRKAMKRKGYVYLGTENLMNRLAVNISYDKHGGRKKEDFLKAIEDMEKIGLVTRVCEVANVTRFYINRDWSNGQEEEISPFSTPK